MKRVMIILLMVAGMGRECRAQFLKNLLNNAVDSAVKHRVSSGATPGGYGSPGGYGKMTGGYGVQTAVDSAEAASVLRSFMTASGGSGMVYQYEARYDVRIRGTNRTMVDTITSEIAENRYTHVEMGVFGMRVSLLKHVGQPRYTVMLHPQTKSYNLSIVDTARLNSANGQTFQITKIGAETVAGYPCIHSKMTVIGADKKVFMVDDVWTSTAVPAYAQMRREMTNEHITVSMMQELEKAGCEGFVVKMSGESPKTTEASQMRFEMVLIRAERKDFLASEFEIPAGWVETGVIGPLK